MTKFTVLDNRRLETLRSVENESLLRARGEVEKELHALRRDKSSLTAQVKAYDARVVELDSLVEAEKKVGVEAKVEAETLRSEVALLKTSVSELQGKLGDADQLPEPVKERFRQEGYHLCHDKLQSQLEEFRAGDFQAGYDFGLDQAGVPTDSELRKPVVPPESEDEENEGAEDGGNAAT